MNKKYQCPKCGGKTFSSTAHVTQDWMLDEHGEFMESISNCVDVTHRPNDDDLWQCLGCDYNAAGSNFRVGGESA